MSLIDYERLVAAARHPKALRGAAGCLQPCMDRDAYILHGKRRGARKARRLLRRHAQRMAREDGRRGPWR